MVTEMSELEQLENELKSYQQNKPWRELLEEEPAAEDNDKEPADDAPARTVDF